MKKLTQAVYRVKRIAIFLFEENTARLPKRKRYCENPNESNDNLSADGQWEIVSEKEVLESLQATSDGDYDTHDFSQTNCSALPLQDFKQLACNFPPSTYMKRLQLIYSSTEHGYSLQTIFRNSALWAEEQHCDASDFSEPCVLVITDTDGHSFGAYCTHLLHDTEKKMVGCGEIQLFKIRPYLQVYSWTGTNDFFLHCNKDHIRIGGSQAKGFGAALWIDKDLSNGRSMKCETFDSDILSSHEDFTIANIEIWGFSSSF